MKNWYFFCLLLVGIVSNAQIKLEGYVGDPQTGSPYDGVSVYIDQVLKAKTNTDGLFALMTTAGKHEIKLTKEGLLDKKETINVGEIDFYETVMVKGVNPKPIIIEEVIEEKPLVISYRLDSLGNPKMDSLGNKIQINPDLKMVKIARDSMVTDSLGNENIFKVYEEKVYALSKDSLVLDSLGNYTAIVPIMKAESFPLDSLGNPIKVMQNYEQVWATRDSIALDSLGNPYTIVVREPITPSDTIKTDSLSAVEPTVEPTLLASSNSAALVIRKRDDGSEAAALNDQKNAKEIKQVVSSEELSNKGVSNAEGAVAEISGVNQVEGLGEIFIRGLGDRYLFTTINKLPIPSNDVEKKNINLNLIPTDVIGSVELSKSNYPYYYADFGSGNVNIITKEFAEKDFFNIGLSSGINTNLTKDNAFSEFKQSSNASLFGFTDRKESYRNRINSSWDNAHVNLPLDFGLNFDGGKSFKIFNKKASFLASLTFDKSYSYQPHEIVKNYSRGSLTFSLDDYKEFKTSTNTIGYSKLSIDLNRKNKLSYITMLINQAEDNVVLGGLNGNGFILEGVPSREGFQLNDRRYKVSTILLNQLHGEHNLSRKLNLDWGMGLSSLKADEPNSIILQLVENGSGNALVIPTNLDTNGRRSIQNINDNEYSTYLNFDYDFDLSDAVSGLVSFGGNGRMKNRDFYATFFGLNVINSLEFENISQTDQIIKQGLVSGDFLFEERGGQPDVYDGSLSTAGVYTNLFLETDLFDINIGARLENNSYSLSWLLNPAAGGQGSFDKQFTNLFPSLNLKYKFNKKMFFRLSGSKTISLPELRELAPFIYEGPNGRFVQGNSNLTPSTVYNGDIKWELYPKPDELLSLGLFAKSIEDPIGTAIDPNNAAGYFRPFNTGSNAEVLGIELETRVGLIKWSQHNKLSTIFNATYMHTEQKLNENFKFNFNETLPLVGAADYIINGSLKYEVGKENPFIITTTANYTSDKIFALGGTDDPSGSNVFGQFNDNIIQNGFVSLDIVASKSFSENLSLKFKAKNIINPSIELKQDSVDIDNSSNTQRGESVIDSYKRGVDLGLSLKYKF